MNKLLFSLLTGILLLTACGNQNHTQVITGKPVVITTFAPLYSFVTNIVDDSFEVKNMVPVGASEHTWEPNPSDILLLSKADVLVTNGLGLESFLQKLVENASNEKLLVVESSKGITTLPTNAHTEIAPEEEDSHEEHEDSLSDPHVWLAPSKAIMQVQNISSELTIRYPEKKDIFEKNAKTYIEKIKVLEQERDNAFKKVTPKPFIVFHGAYQYFLTDLGIFDYQKASLEPFPGKEPGPLYLSKLEDLIKKENIRIIFTEPQFSPKVVEILKQRLNVRTYELDPIGMTISKVGYEELMNYLTKTFTTAFSTNE